MEARGWEIISAIWQAQGAIENSFRWTHVFCFPSGLFAILLTGTLTALAPGLHDSAPSLTPKITVTTEHTRTEVYRIRQGEDVDKLLSGLKVTKEQLDRLKRQLLGRYLYLVTAKTVPLKTDLQSSPLRGRVGMVPESERTGVVFHVKLEARRNGQAFPHWTYQRLKNQINERNDEQAKFSRISRSLPFGSRRKLSSVVGLNSNGFFQF